MDWRDIAVKPNSFGFRTSNAVLQATPADNRFEASGSKRGPNLIPDRMIVPHSIFRLTRSLALLIPILCLSAVPDGMAQNPPQGSEQKVEKEFYTPKDRVAAIQAATIYVPKAVADANILQGPDQDPKLF
jgi:hypothetical protein